MAEIAIAFPNDEASAAVIVSRLDAAGIAARIDRGLAASYQVAPIGHITVLVAEKDAERASTIVGARNSRPVTPVYALWIVLGLLLVALVLGLAALVELLTR